MKMRNLVCPILAVCGFAAAASAQITLSQSTNGIIIQAGNSVACAVNNTSVPPTQQTVVNFYWRSYQLSTFPAVTGPFNVTSVKFGVENATHPNGTQDVRVRLYKDTNGGAPVAVGTDLIQVAEATVAVPNGTSQFITAPITGSFAQTDFLVVSIDTPDYFTPYGGPTPPAQNAVFFVGSNSLGQSGPSYLSAPGCGITTPTTTAGIGFPNMHILLDVNGTVGSSCYPDCNGDGVLGLADFGCFQTKFATNNMYADCNGDGVLGLADFGCFQTKFALGCP
jgi:hypothetical protein